jgi:hypothetical protein
VFPDIGVLFDYISVSIVFKLLLSVLMAMKGHHIQSKFLK